MPYNHKVGGSITPATCQSFPEQDTLPQVVSQIVYIYSVQEEGHVHDEGCRSSSSAKSLPHSSSTVCIVSKDTEKYPKHGFVSVCHVTLGLCTSYSGL